MSLSPSKQYFTTPARNRTWASTFEESRDVPFTTRVTDPGAGVEPALTGSESAVLPLDDPGNNQ